MMDDGTVNPVSASGNQVQTALLLAALQRQRMQVAASLQRLESGPRELIPTVDSAQWQGPARWAYDVALGLLRANLATVTVMLRTTEQETATAIAVLSRRVG
jgi:hypothetical protein